MMNSVRKMEQSARKAIESIYFGLATVTEYEKETDEVTKLTVDVPVITLRDEPCRLSFETLKAVDQSESAAYITQVTKLFVSPDVTIKPGSKITVTQDGLTTDYTYSGVPAYYATHQEIMLELWETYA